MHKTAWRLQDAKAQFSAVVDAALGGEAQVVTWRGLRAIVVLAATDCDRLRQGERALAPGFIGHLLAMPRAPAPTRSSETRRAAIRLGDVDLE